MLELFKQGNDYSDLKAIEDHVYRQYGFQYKNII